MRIPNVRPGNSFGHRAVTRIASTALGITIIRAVGPRIDPTLIRLTGGRLSSVTPFPALLLSHTCARTGVTRTTPIVYFTDAGRVIVIASNFGAPSNPAWYHNLKANPVTTAEVGSQTFTVLARELDGGTRARLWPALVARYPTLAEHQARTARQVPVIMLTRQESAR